MPDMSPLARRLARRCWPGPVTLVVDNQHRDGLTGHLPKPVRQLVTPNGTIGLRVPANETLLDVLRMLTGPIVLTSANRSGEPDSVSADEVVQSRRRRRGPGARRRTVPLWAAVVGRPREKQSLRAAARRRGGRGHARAAGQHHGAVRLHGKHLPQPDGRAPDAGAAGRTLEV